MHMRQMGFLGGPKHGRVEEHPPGASPLFLTFRDSEPFGARHWYERSGDLYLYIGQREDEYTIQFD